jgi:hypothetical protein
MKRLSIYQNRVFNWQRDVAGQPVTTIANQRDPAFYDKQMSYVYSEWYDEYLPHSIDYSKALAENTQSLLLRTPASTESLIESAKRIENLRIELADDVGDVAFTLLGLLNASGLTIGTTLGMLPSFSSFASAETSVNIDLFELAKGPSYDTVRRVEGALLSLVKISDSIGFSFYEALEAVCDSNDTKLWTEEEVSEIMDNASHNGWLITRLKSRSGRCFRVNAQNMKLIKSPSFTPPDLKRAVFGYSVLT